MTIPVAQPDALDWSCRQIAIPTALGGVRLPAPGAHVGRLTGRTMGTTWSVSFVDEQRTDAPMIRPGVERCLDRVIAEMSTWEGASDISRFNRSAGEWQELPEWFAVVLTAALGIAGDSGGAYDPTSGRLVDLWGFGPPGRRSRAPHDGQIGAALERCGWQRLEFDAATRRARQPGGMSLDLSAIAKGFAVDAVARQLRAEGIDSCLVEIGGELRGHGVKPGAQPWWVLVEPPLPLAPQPRPAAATFELLIALHGLSVATSGDYRKGFAADGRWFSHTIDPRTGRPVGDALASVTVLHRECVMADALATALMVLGLEAGLAFAAERHLAALFVERAGENVRPHATPALEAMLQ